MTQEQIEYIVFSAEKGKSKGTISDGLYNPIKYDALYSYVEKQLRDWFDKNKPDWAEVIAIVPLSLGVSRTFHLLNGKEL